MNTLRSRTVMFAPRQQRIVELEEKLFDLLIIGGGITGAAVARDAGARGLAVALIEKDDWASGTSWRSSKLIHGGLRYLKTGNLGLVFESLSERAILSRAAPHLVRPSNFLFPTYRGWGISPLALQIGLTAYDLLALGRSAHWHRRLSRDQTLDREELLERPELAAGGLYCDARTDDARLTLENVLDAAVLGALAVSRVEVEGLEKDGSGAVRGARVRDRESGKNLSLRARVVVNAAGPWADVVRRLDDASEPDILRLSRGAHVAVPASRLPVHETIAFPMNDGRLLFAIPYASVTLLGTTDTDHRGSPEEVVPTADDVAYILAAASRTFPGAALARQDVVSAFSGLRPLVRQPGRNLTQTSREEAIVASASQLLTVTGGKLTTHRAMAQRAVDRAAAMLARQGVRVRASATRGRPFPGKPDRPMAEFVSYLRATTGVDLRAETVEHLAWRYGSRAQGVIALAAADRALLRPLCAALPDIDAEIVFGARAEDARSLADSFIRRSHVFWQDPGQGRQAMERAAALLAAELGWSARARQADLDGYAAEISRSHRWQESSGNAQ